MNIPGFRNTSQRDREDGSVCRRLEECTVEHHIVGSAKVGIDQTPAITRAGSGCYLQEAIVIKVISLNNARIKHRPQCGITRSVVSSLSDSQYHVVVGSVGNRVPRLGNSNNISYSSNRNLPQLIVDKNK